MQQHPGAIGQSGSRRRQRRPRSGVLTIDNESGGTWTCDFNPFNLTYISFALGPVYEPLVFVNTLQSGKTTPWLATKWAWSTGNKTLTFTIRNGVKFTDGDPLTPADVAYTFNLLKKTRRWTSMRSGRPDQRHRLRADQVVMNVQAARGHVLLLHRRPDRDRRRSTSGPRSPTR